MKTPYFKYIFALLLFGSNGIVASLIHLSSYEIVLLRTLIGSLLLIAIFFIAREKLTFYKHKTQSVFLAISGIAMGTSWIFLYEAYDEIGVSLASLAYYCGPVIVMMLSPLLFGEKLTKIKVCSFLVVLVGIFLVNGTAFENGVSVWGLACGLLSAVCYSLMVMFNKKAKDITGLENAMLQLFVAFLTVAIFVGIKQGYRMEIDTRSILPILVLGLLNTGIGCYFYFSSIRKLPVQTVAICGYLEPLSAVVFSVIFLNETMLPLQIVGAVLIIGGAILGEYRKRQI
ncbi:MAG: EamA family transporter [Clostridia bacterium]|nr:EamA family transporter [Clostridia bacterium]